MARCLGVVLRWLHYQRQTSRRRKLTRRVGAADIADAAAHAHHSAAHTRISSLFCDLFASFAFCLFASRAYASALTRAAGIRFEDDRLLLLADETFASRLFALVSRYRGWRQAVGRQWKNRWRRKLIAAPVACINGGIYGFLGGDRAAVVNSGVGEAAWRWRKKHGENNFAINMASGVVDNWRRHRRSNIKRHRKQSAIKWRRLWRRSAINEVWQRRHALWAHLRWRSFGRLLRVSRRSLDGMVAMGRWRAGAHGCSGTMGKMKRFAALGQS